MNRTPKYPGHGHLRDELNRRVNAYFTDNNLSKTGGRRLLLKAIIIVTWFVLSYVALLFWAEAWWLIGLCAVSVGLAHAGIGFSIMHDGGHGAASKRTWVTRLAAYSLDLIGGSSHLWAFKHNVIHHQFPNVDGVDHDIVVRPWLRLTETQKRHGFHRAQFLYYPLAYTFVAVKWLLHDDFRTLLKRRLGDSTVSLPPIPRRKVVEILLFKLFTFSWALALPIVLHGLAWTLAAFLVWTAVSGFALAIVFQLAHSVATTEITPLPENGSRLENTWAEQQLISTMDFAPNNRVLSWYVGGLNFQIEHHLFPRISHVHYPALAPIVREVCGEFDVPYHCQKSMWAAIKDHTRHLRALGRGERVTRPSGVADPSSNADLATIALQQMSEGSSFEQPQAL